MGMWFSWQMGAASSDLEEATSPSTATTLSSEMSFRTIVAGSPATERSSSVMRSIFFPSTPAGVVDFAESHIRALVRRFPEAGAAAGERGEFADLDLILRLAGSASASSDEAAKRSAEYFFMAMNSLNLFPMFPVQTGKSYLSLCTFSTPIPPGRLRLCLGIILGVARTMTLVFIGMHPLFCKNDASLSPTRP